MSGRLGEYMSVDMMLVLEASTRIATTQGMDGMACTDRRESEPDRTASFTATSAASSAVTDVGTTGGSFGMEKGDRGLAAGFYAFA